jgi:hypothetical protein
MSFLSDMLAAITERGKALADFTVISQAATPMEQITALCRSLLSSRGEASALATASEILMRYRELDRSAKLEFFRMLLAPLRRRPTSVRPKRCIGCPNRGGRTCSGCSTSRRTGLPN